MSRPAAAIRRLPDGAIDILHYRARAARERAAAAGALSAWIAAFLARRPAPARRLEPRIG